MTSLLWERKAERFSEKEKTKRIMKWIRYSDSKLRKRFTFLRHQNALGFGIVIGSASGMILLGSLYIASLIPFWFCILGSAIFASFLHEMEHGQSLVSKRNPSFAS